MFHVSRYDGNNISFCSNYNKNRTYILYLFLIIEISAIIIYLLVNTNFLMDKKEQMLWTIKQRMSY